MDVEMLRKAMAWDEECKAVAGEVLLLDCEPPEGLVAETTLVMAGLRTHAPFPVLMPVIMSLITHAIILGYMVGKGGWPLPEPRVGSDENPNGEGPLGPAPLDLG